MRYVFWALIVAALVVLCFGAKTVIYGLLGLLALLIVDLLLTRPK